MFAYMYVCIYTCTDEALFTFSLESCRPFFSHQTKSSYSRSDLVSCSGDLRMTKGGSELFLAEKNKRFAL